MKGLILNSGGIDSPVACYLMADHDLVAVHFDNQVYGSAARTALKVIEKLSELLKKEIPLYTVPHGDNLSAFVRTCSKEEKKYTCIFCKRMMLRTAEYLAHREECTFLVTGENLGQVASQTLRNIYVISRAVEMPIVRPLIGLDKLDIIAIAERIGTYNISIEKAACCDAVPQYPAIRAQLEKIEALERNMDIDDLVRTAVEQMK
ncbi:MAG: hypothetical protein HXS48_19165 [Theionarchaea archaeon]|nr:hypothetical protein [Theionarchaea archaeon]